MQAERAPSLKNPWPMLCFLFSFLLIGSGCQSSGVSGKSENRPVTGQADSHGYALLADLCGDEKDVSKLRFLKRERPALKALLQEIAATNRVAHEALQKFAKEAPTLNLKDMGLPNAEVAARQAISKFKEHAILSSKGKDLELQLLLDQNEALTYGSHLAQVVAQSESEPRRREFLEQLAAALGTLQKKVLQALSSAYAPS